MRRQATLYYFTGEGGVICYKVVLLDEDRSFVINSEEGDGAGILEDIDATVNFGENTEEDSAGVPITIEENVDGIDNSSARIDKSRLTPADEVDWDFYRDYVDHEEKEGQQWDQNDGPPDEALL